MLCCLLFIMSLKTAINLPYNGRKYKDEENCENQNGAMLDMLAEVATQKLWADKRPKTSAAVSSPSPAVALQQPATPTPRRKRSREASGMPLSQAKMLSVNQLLRTFSRLESDELRRVFSYQCLLIPKKCKVSFESFASEARARNLIKEHLLIHLDELPEGEILEVPKQQEEVVVKKPITVKAPRRTKTLNPVDNKNIEITEIPIEVHEVVVKEEKTESDNLIISENNLVCTTVAECYDELQVTIPEASQMPDHDYYRSPQEPESILPDTEDYTDVETIWVKTDDKDDLATGITNYVVTVTDSDDPAILSVSNEVVVKTETEENVNISTIVVPQVQIEQQPTIKSGDLPVLQDNRVLDGEKLFEESYIERDEHRQHKKPKGKAKFIGQSAAEKEMAIHMIESMKLRQGSGEPLECQICVPARVFTAPTTLISHYRSHAGIKPYECHLCGGVFTRQHSLNYHLLIHSNKTRFTCSDCGRKFRHPSHFKEHQRRHTGEAPFECSDCIIRFKTRNTYKRHLKTRHGKVLTQSGGIIILSEEEFRRVRTAPRALQTRVSSDKENSSSRRTRPKSVNFIRRKQKKGEEKVFSIEEGDDFIQKYNLSGSWTTNLLEPEVKVESEDQQAVTILQAVTGAVGGGGGGPTTVMVLSAGQLYL